MKDFDVRKYPARIALLVLVLALTAAVTNAQQLDRYLVLYPSISDYGDPDLFAASFFSDGALESSASTPRSISAQKYKEFALEGIPDGEGGAFIAYTIEHTDSAYRGDRDILMRHLDRGANDRWGDSTRPMIGIARSDLIEQNPKIVPLSDGTLMVLYEVYYRKGDSLTDIDIAAVKLARDGAQVWSKGIWVANTKRHERLAGAVSDGRGGATVIMESQIVRDSTMTSDILAAHVDGAGTVAWGASKDPLPVAASRHNERRPAVIGDSTGYVYIAYEIEYTSGERLGDVDILAQRLSPYGVREWVDEMSLAVVSSSDNATESSPAIMLDSGGVVVAFEIFYRSEKRPLRLIGVQRMDLAGKLVWNNGKKPELFAVGDRVSSKPRLLADPAGGTFLLFEAHDTISNDRDVYAQKLTRQGTPLWGDGKTPLAIFSGPGVERDAVAIAEPGGGLVVVAVREMPGEMSLGTPKLIAQRVTFEGTLPWTDLGGPIILSTTSSRDLPAFVVRSR